MAISGAHSVDVCFVTDEVMAVKWMVALASRTYGKDQMRKRERERRCMGCDWRRASSCSVAHHSHGNDCGMTMWPYRCSSSGASCLGGWSSSRRSYVRGGLGDGAPVVTRLAGNDATAAALHFALLWSHA